MSKIYDHEFYSRCLSAACNNYPCCQCITLTDRRSYTCKKTQAISLPQEIKIKPSNFLEVIKSVVITNHLQTQYRTLTGVCL